jgi:CRP-like cAMP-binding protein
MYDHSSNSHSHSSSHAGGTSHGHTDSSPLAELLMSPALAARRMTVAPGKVLYETATDARSLYFIHRGQVRTYRIDDQQNGRLLEILGPEDWCGEAALARQPQYGERAVVVVASIVTEVAADRLLPMLNQHPRAAVELMKQLANKLSAARADAAGLVFDDCHSRLLKTLVRFSHSAAAAPHPDGVVLRITHQQLAQAVGVARETVSLALTQLRQANVLRTGRNQLMFNPDNLRTFTRGRVDESRDSVVNGG